MIEMIDESGIIHESFSNAQECAWEVFGDERQIKLAIKYKRMAYGFYWREIND
jgi:hypothetical protein